MTQQLDHSLAGTEGHDFEPRILADRDVMRGFPPPPECRVNLTNWDHPPYNRWAFQNMRSVVPTRHVLRGDGPIADLPYAPQDLSDVVFETLDDRNMNLGALLDESYTDAFMILHDGKVVTERYFGAMTDSSLHLSQSVSKSIVGTLAGVLVHQGLLDLAAPVTDYIPELAQSGYRDALVGQVLNMTSGVRFSEDYGNPDADVTWIESAAGWRPPPAAGAPDSIYDYIMTLDQERPHGEVFKYRSVETATLGWILERAGGLGLPELLSREIWSKLGVESDASYTVDRAGAAAADGGFNATLRDYARFAQMHLDMGSFNGTQIVPAAWIESSRRGKASLFGAPYTDDLPKGAYSNQWWIADRHRGIYLALGIFGQMLYLDPAHRFAAVKLSSWPTPLHGTFKLNTLRAMAAVSKALAG